MERNYLGSSWSTISVFRDDILCDPAVVYTSVCGHNDAVGGASLFYTTNVSDCLFDVYSTNGSSWNGKIYISNPSGSTLGYPVSLEKAISSSVTYVTVKAKSFPYGILNQTKDNSQAGTYSGMLKMAAGDGSDNAISKTVNLYRRIELIDTSTGGLLTVQFGNISGKTSSFRNIDADISKDFQLPNANAISDFMNTTPFNLNQTDSINVEFGVRSRGWNRGANIVFELVDSSTSKSIRQIQKYNVSPMDTSSFFQESANQIVNRLQDINGALRVRIDSVNYDNLVVNYMNVMVFENANGSIIKTPKSILQIGNLPTEFRLSQNYPNPFNPSTMINYTLPASSRVVLKVYDVLGREVRTLVDQYQAGGYYNVVFDASNLPSGLYFYRINAGTYSATKKLMLVK